MISPATVTIQDILGIHYWALEYTHKMWAYFQALMVGAAAFAWTGDNPRSPGLLVGVTLGVGAFAYFNGSLISEYQGKAAKTAVSINEAWEGAASTPAKLNVKEIFCPASAKQAVTLYACLAVATIIAIWVRTVFAVFS